MRTARFVAILILFAGACLTGRALCLHAKAELASILIRRAWNQSIGTGKPHAPWPWADTHPIARLRIPRLRYDEIVLEGATARTLAFGPARVMSGADIGKAGELVLAGHRTSWFRALEGIAEGDSIMLDWLDAQGELQRRVYSVQAVRVVQAEDLANLTPSTEDSLMLITCYPFGKSLRSPQRFIVEALPLAAEQFGAATESRRGEPSRPQPD